MEQALRAVCEASKDIHPVVPDPYSLLANPLSTRTCDSVLDLKGAVFCIPLAPKSQEFFAFE